LSDEHPYTALVRRKGRTGKQIEKDIEQQRRRLYHIVSDAIASVLMDNPSKAVSISVAEEHTVNGNDQLVIKLFPMDVPHSASVKEALAIMDRSEQAQRNRQLLNELAEV
jgi:hypothetical protein